MNIHPNKITGKPVTIFFRYILLTFILLSFSPYALAKNLTSIAPRPEHSSQCIQIIKALERYHYLEKNLGN